MSRDEHWFHAKEFGKWFVNAYVYLRLWAALYDYTNITSIWLYCTDLIHSVATYLHKETIL